MTDACPSCGVMNETSEALWVEYVILYAGLGGTIQNGNQKTFLNEMTPYIFFVWEYDFEKTSPNL